MDNTEQNFPQNLQIQGILDEYLNARSTTVSSQISTDSHLNEDFLAAFIEGSLNRRESNATVKHLADCSFCRQMTSELIKLDDAFAEHNTSFADVKESEPSKISEVLSGLLSRLFGSSDGAVFAHEEKPESEKTEEKKDSEDDK